MKEGIIRPLALVVFRKGDLILAQEGADPATGKLFYRPLGGGIEVGERAADAAVREIGEELHAEITNLRFLGVLENIFTFRGEPGHEIIFQYLADLVHPEKYDQPRLEIDENGEVQYAAWVSLTAIQNGEITLYPQGLLELILASEKVRVQSYSNEF
jgi:ADP-ribose pyrophosphatase YjhB (NUDIX family)